MTDPKTHTYQINHPGTLLHIAGKYWLVRDIDEPTERTELKARIASGDYLNLLASDLDEISQYIVDTNEQQSVMLQKAIDDLIYLDRHYRLTSK